MLLLFLMLPGLLAPAGFGLQRCCCTGGLRITDTRSSTLVSAAFVQPTTQPSGACCQASKPDRSDDEVAGGAQAPGCNCSLQRAPDWKPEPYVPGPGPELPTLAVADVQFVVLPVALAVRLPCETAARAPPPPGAQRNLPLRL